VKATDFNNINTCIILVLHKITMLKVYEHINFFSIIMFKSAYIYNKAHSFCVEFAYLSHNNNTLEGVKV